MSTFVSLNGKFLKITQDEDGEFKISHCTQEEYEDESFHASIFEEGRLKKLLQNDINDATNEAYDDFKKSLKQNIKGAVLNMLGFENRYNGWAVDRCNGRMSAVTELLAQETKDLLKTEAAALIEREKENFLKEAHATIIDEFRSCFLKEVKYNARKGAEEASKIFIHKLMTEEVEKFKKEAIEAARNALLASQGFSENKPAR